ncbi:MAG: hypothetical protein HY875_13105 [Chloroflexi bacterium]|nr:hypothetical protein [Chloroflexota bacterium]
MPERPSVAGVRFRNAGKIFYFHTAGMRLDPGEYVVVETTRGPEVARVVIAPDQVVVNELGDEPLKPILRLATDEDIRRADAQKTRAEEVLPEARRLAEETGFPAHIDGAEFTLDGKRLTISFSSEERLDYRDFIRRAGDRFGARVEMRQLGARDRAKLAGGYGVCGRELCCASWLTTFPSISIRMAKDQELPLNPQKISGLCGRLLCCLSYEDEGYREMRKTLPKIGQRCSTPTGEGKVIAINILRRQVTLLVEGQRVEVGDRDLGTVVRWDTSSKSAPPPPSISRADAIEQGLIEATEEDLAPPVPALEPDWITQQAPVREEPGPGRGRLPGGGPRRNVPPKRDEAKRGEGREPRGGTGQQPQPGQQRGGRPAGEPRRGRPGEPRGGRNEPPANLPGGRVFQRSTEGPPPPERREPPSPGAAGEGEQAARRRRGRRGGRGRGPGGGESAPE